MLDSSVIDGTNIVTAIYAGSLSKEEMEEMSNTLHRVAGVHKTVRLLIELGDIDLRRIEPGAIWEDLKLFGMLDELERYALVADQGWVTQLAKVTDAVVPFEFEIFPTERRDDALAWLQQPSDPET